MNIEIDGPFGFSLDSDWHFDGNPLEFQWLVRWGMLLRVLYQEKHSDPLSILLDTQKAEAAMEERGITERAITMEMIRNGLELAVSYSNVSLKGTLNDPLEGPR